MAYTIFSYPHIEDYIEIIAGYRKPDGTAIKLFEPIEPLLSLARYDVNVVDSLANQTILNNTGYTDRQAPLARDIVYKYERQLIKHHISIDTVKEKPAYRLATRTLDRSSRSWIDNDKIYIKFPFDSKLIENIREYVKTSPGQVQFNRELKLWEADLTESNVNWAYAFSQVNQFEIDATLQTTMDLILGVEKQPYAIELRAGDQLVITNAVDSLTSYVNEQLGGFDLENLLTLVDNSPILGYTVEPIIEQTVIEAYGTRFYSLCANREVKVDLNSNTVDQVSAVVHYAEITNRFPIFVYEPDLSDRITMLFMRHFNTNEVVNLDSGKENITKDTKFVHVRKIPKTPVDRIPLLITSAGMIYGGDRQMWLQTAEKSVYFTKDVYTKNGNKGREICKLD